MMEQYEFIQRVLHKPWVNRAISFDEMDCHGLNVLYHRHVLGIDPTLPKGYLENLPMGECWMGDIDSGQWIEIDRPKRHGVVFTAYCGERPMHVGIMLNRTRVIHCRGSEDNPGRVEIHSIQAIKRAYGKISYHIHRDLINAPDRT